MWLRAGVFGQSMKYSPSSIAFTVERICHFDFADCFVNQTVYKLRTQPQACKFEGKRIILFVKQRATSVHASLNKFKERYWECVELVKCTHNVSQMLVLFRMTSFSLRL